MQKRMTESILLAHLALALLALKGNFQMLRFSQVRGQTLLLHRFITTLMEINELSACWVDEAIHKESTTHKSLH